MPKTLYLVNIEPPEIRIAALRDGRLFDFDIDRGGRLLGDIYKGQVENVLPGMDAAFVNVGLAHNALIYAGDVAVGQTEGIQKSAEPIQKLLTPGENLIVQIARPPIGSKGARVTTRISLSGRYVAVVDHSDTVGVSRRIEDEEERSRLRRIADKLRPLDHGLIIRTEAEHVSEAELTKDVDVLCEQLHILRERALRVQAPALLYRELGILGRLARDRLNNEVEAVLIDSQEEFQAFRELVIALAPQLAQRVEFYDEPVPIFHKFRLDDEIKQAAQHIVPLPHGGSLTIDETEALTAIDVNTAKFVGKNRLAETVLKTNLEAIEEASRQIRLRDLGGVIVIDFIDTGRTRDRVQVMDALEAALKLDRTRTRIVQLSPSGLVEMTRRREGQSLRQMLHRPCPYCSGDGVVKNELSVGIDARRQVRAVAGRTPGAAVKVTLHPEMAPAFLGPDGDLLVALEQSSEIKVFLRVDFNLHLEATRIETGQCEEFETGGKLAPGAQLHLLPHTRFYPEDAPQFTVLEDMLVRLNKPLEIHRKPGQPPTQKPSALEIIEVSRWCIAARVLAYGEPMNT